MSVAYYVKLNLDHCVLTVDLAWLRSALNEHHLIGQTQHRIRDLADQRAFRAHVSQACASRLLGLTTWILIQEARDLPGILFQLAEDQLTTL